MRLFKLSLKNIRKSFHDYTVYFMTLVLGVAIFYIFNAMDAQTAMIMVSSSTHEIIDLLISMISGVSVLIAFILGFLIIYASNFMIRKRKKEFAIYMTLGMGKRGVSNILLGENVFVGILSLTTGLLIGVFASQFMSILVAKLFEADMSRFAFTVSKDSIIKTIIYFSIIYVIVMIFNAISISKYQLIDLLNASKKNEKAVLRGSFISILFFIISVSVLGFCYYQVGFNTNMLSRNNIIIIIFMGTIGTFLLFWSVSGFLLKILQKCKKIYYKNLNAFIFRQLNSNINTAVFSMTVITLLFFATIVILSSGFAMNNAFKKDMRKNCPVDVNLYKEQHPADGLSEEELIWRKSSIEENLIAAGLDLNLLKEDYVEISVYQSPDLTFESFTGDLKAEISNSLPLFDMSIHEDIISNTEYNKIAKLYNQPLLQVEQGKYILVCNFKIVEDTRNKVLKSGGIINIGDVTLSPQETACQDGFIYCNIQDSNVGFFVVPDEVVQQEKGKGLEIGSSVLSANYVGESKEELTKIEDIINRLETQKEMGDINFFTKIGLYESAIGLSAVITFLAIYIGIIFLIVGTAMLALKELAESTNNKERYKILDKIGVDRKDKNKALLTQMGLFFGIPLSVACIHAVFGILFTRNIMGLFSTKDLTPSIIGTGIFLVIIYGGYFLATYCGSKRIIEEQ